MSGLWKHGPFPIEAYMIELDDDVIDRNIIRMFRLLWLLNIVKENYEYYGLSWGDRQQYIYRQLSRLDAD